MYNRTEFVLNIIDVYYIIRLRCDVRLKPRVCLYIEVKDMYTYVFGGGAMSLNAIECSYFKV